MDKYFQENGFFPMGQSMRVVLKIISQMGKVLFNILKLVIVKRKMVFQKWKYSRR